MKNTQPAKAADRPRELGAAFDAYLTRRRKLSPRTIQAYRYNGARMIQFFQAHGAKTINDVTVELAEKWITWLLKEGRSDASTRP